MTKINTYHLTQEELRRLQLIELELLKEAHRICYLRGIRYNIIAGTLLGAVRHGGFIPWDDDADIALLRPEYERFREACRTDLDQDKFYFQDHTNTPGYRWGYGKLRRRGTLFLRAGQEHMPYEQGVFIDVFPLDAIPDRHWQRALYNFRCFCVRKLLWSKVGQGVEKDGLKRSCYRWMAALPEDRALAIYDRLVEKSRGRETKWVRILTFPTPGREYGYLRCWYEESGRIEFEGSLFWGIKEYEDYLTFKFGEYRKLPPEQERKVHPVTKLRLTETKST